VGPIEVARGREMHWLRIDTYYTGEPENPQTYHQPVMCMHCEHAPCEVVCPVAATTHSSDGLNEMTYNRCIGTRYCSNNCPYKVRRFNFFDYQEPARQLPVLQLLQNPEVTVRSRGVMEKCTYCVQRISKARLQAGMENRDIEDGEVVTACQAVCPTRAIIFGDISQTKSQVSQEKASPLSYGLLEDLNTKPRTTYLAAVRNPHPELRPE
jgi:Fe-S-cluster-containing dehydrogenase component